MVGIISVALIALLTTNVFCTHEGSLKHGHDHPLEGQIGYGLESEEREMHGSSIDDHAPASCGLLGDNSDSAEHGYDFDEHPGQEPRRGFSVKAAAAASSSSYS